VIAAVEALTRLRDGNSRFIAGQLTDQALS